MTRLKYSLKSDTLFKMLFTKNQDLLRRLVSALLGIEYENITEFSVTNPEISPEELGKKFCRLDINMVVNGQKVDLELQIGDEGNYPERSLFYWAREYSTGIEEGQDYSLLPRTIVISILGFNQFPNPEKFHHEFQCLEITTHEPLTDKMVLQFYELKKLAPLSDADSGRDLWLKLFNAETEEELKKIEEMGVSFMSEAVMAYRHVAASPEFREIERVRSKARHDEAQAIYNAEQRGAETERKRWQGVVADKDAAIADKDAAIADKDAENEKLRLQLLELRALLSEK
jgi:predicted transposase/invertase (TIGR01784 family)